MYTDHMWILESCGVMHANHPVNYWNLRVNRRSMKNPKITITTAPENCPNTTNQKIIKNDELQYSGDQLDPQL